MRKRWLGSLCIMAALISSGMRTAKAQAVRSTSINSTLASLYALQAMSALNIGATSLGFTGYIPLVSQEETVTSGVQVQIRSKIEKYFGNVRASQYIPGLPGVQVNPVTGWEGERYFVFPEVVIAGSPIRDGHGKEDKERQEQLTQDFQKKLTGIYYRDASSTNLVPFKIDKEGDPDFKITRGRAYLLLTKDDINQGLDSLVIEVGYLAAIRKESIKFLGFKLTSSSHTDHSSAAQLNGLVFVPLRWPANVPVPNPAKVLGLLDRWQTAVGNQMNKDQMIYSYDPILDPDNAFMDPKVLFPFQFPDLVTPFTASTAREEGIKREVTKGDATPIHVQVSPGDGEKNKEGEAEPKEDISMFRAVMIQDEDLTSGLNRQKSAKGSEILTLRVKKPAKLHFLGSVHYPDQEVKELPSRFEIPVRPGLKIQVQFLDEHGRISRTRTIDEKGKEIEKDTTTGAVHAGTPSAVSPG